MRILLTGGAGYVGSRVAAHLLEAGVGLTVVDKLMYGGEGLLPLLDHPRFSLVPEDIRNADLMRSLLAGMDGVIHMAAIVGDPACRVDLDASRSINLESTELLVRLAKEVGVGRFVFMSSCSNYGVVDADVIADEECPVNPLSFYAETKVLAEKAVLSAADKQFAACVLRCATVCGISNRMRFDLLVNEMARNAVLGKEILVYAPEAWRPFLHIRDAAEAIWCCLTATRTSVCGQVFNVVGENYRKRQLAELVAKHFPNAQIRVSDAKVDARDYRASAERIARILGFRPTHSIEQAFLEVARAVSGGVFNDPFDPFYEALPDAESLRKDLPSPAPVAT
jgi:nucleoside-diphosphate-sugar epimerase